MTYEITKNSTIFDRDKIGVGDIVEFDEYRIKLFGKIGELSHKRVGIVTSVEPETIWIKTQDDYYSNKLEGFGLPIERRDQIKVIYRSYYNAKKGEKYGQID